jgi:hypothetical protein
VLWGKITAVWLIATLGLYLYQGGICRNGLLMKDDWEYTGNIQAL